eukprot:1547018-Rhodomonas_salina.1
MCIRDSCWHVRWYADSRISVLLATVRAHAAQYLRWYSDTHTYTPELNTRNRLFSTLCTRKAVSGIVFRSAVD